MDIIKDGTRYRCKDCDWRGTDHDVPKEFWHTDSCMEAYWWYPTCPVCEGDLLNISIYGEERVEGEKGPYD